MLLKIICLGVGVFVFFVSSIFKSLKIICLGVGVFVFYVSSICKSLTIICLGVGIFVFFVSFICKSLKIICLGVGVFVFFVSRFKDHLFRSWIFRLFCFGLKIMDGSHILFNPRSSSHSPHLYFESSPSALLIILISS